MLNIISVILLAYVALYALAAPVPRSDTKGIVAKSTYEGGISTKFFNDAVQRSIYMIAVERCGPTAQC